MRRCSISGLLKTSSGVKSDDITNGTLAELKIH